IPGISPASQIEKSTLFGQLVVTCLRHTAPGRHPIRETGGKVMQGGMIMRGGLHVVRQGWITVTALAIVGCLAWTAVRAEEAPPAPPASPPAPSGQKGGGPASTPRASQAAAEQHKLPPDSTTKQTLELPGRTLAFSATAGSIRLFDDKGEPQADIAYTSYQLDGVDRATRPVTFVF